MDKALRQLLMQHRNEMFRKEKQLLTEKHQLQRGTALFDFHYLKYLHEFAFLMIDVCWFLLWLKLNKKIIHSNFILTVLNNSLKSIDFIYLSLCSK